MGDSEQSSNAGVSGPVTSPREDAGHGPDTTPRGAQEIDIFELWRVIWHGKWLVAGLTSLFLALALGYSFTATEWYRAEVLLAPAKQQSGSGLAGKLGGLGSLAGLAGISVGDSDDVESIAILGSRDFVRAFIEDRQLLPVLFADQWDSEQQQWLDTDPDEQPDLKDAVKYFLDDVHHIEQDVQTGLVTLAIEWTSPDDAAAWAADLVSRLNDYTRQRALREAERNIAYLQQQMEKSTVVSLRDSIAGLIETELQQSMLANGTEEFAYKVIDSARPPKEPIRPKKVLIVLLALILGGTVSLFVVLLRHGIRQRLSADAGR